MEAFKISNDPALAEKPEDIVGLYLNPPEHALVLCADANGEVFGLCQERPIRNGSGFSV